MSEDDQKDTYYAKNREKRLAYQRAYAEAHREEHRVYDAANREKRRARYLSRREEYVAKQHEYNTTHRDEMRAKARTKYATQRDEIASRAIAYQKAHPEKVKVSKRKYNTIHRDKKIQFRQALRAKKAGAQGSFTADQWRALCDWFGNICLACGSLEIGVDHVVPLSKGGTNDISNLQLLCRHCNRIKYLDTIDYRDPDLLAAFLAAQS